MRIPSTIGGRHPRPRSRCRARIQVRCGDAGADADRLGARGRGDAKRRLRPDELADRTPFTWEVPRVERAAGRHFTLRIAAPEAPAGRGLRVAVGPPDYRWGTLRAGGRAQWGDLVFTTRATRAHVVDVLRQWRRETPGVLGSDAALVTILLALNLAAGAVIWHLARPSSPGASQMPPGAPRRRVTRG